MSCASSGRKGTRRTFSDGCAVTTSPTAIFAWRSWAKAALRSQGYFPTAFSPPSTALKEPDTAGRRGKNQQSENFAAKGARG